MNVQQLRDILATIDGQASNMAALVRCDGAVREIETVEIRPTADQTRRPRDVFVLIVADGPSDISEPSPITIRSPRE